jgi:uncharacterized membrane-anchored protein
MSVMKDANHLVNIFAALMIIIELIIWVWYGYRKGFEE